MKPYSQVHVPAAGGRGPKASAEGLVEGIRGFLRGALGGAGISPHPSGRLSKAQQRLSAQELYLRQLKQRYSRVTRCC